MRLTSYDTVWPVPLRLTTAVLLADELLTKVSVPLVAPATVGSNCTVSVTVWFGFNVSGKLAPVIEKAVLLIVAELTVTDVVPVELKVID